MSDIHVPINTSQRHLLDDRLKNLVSFFTKEFGSAPSFIAKVPGRVNIIGEHVDYSGYPVLPMAIKQNILVAGKLCENEIFLHNTDSNYSSFKCSVRSLRDNPEACYTPEWYNYFLCGIRGIYEYLQKDEQKYGICAAISGNIPPASGLSSSSALVSSATLATAFLHNVPLDKKILSKISAKCEQYMGTLGGGMDQAIAFFASQNYAQYIEFYPELKAYPVVLPKNAIFVIANSLSECNKAATSYFNERVVECRLSVHILAKHMKLSNWRTINKFVILQNLLGCNLKQMEELVKKILKKDFYTKNDILSELELTMDELEHEFLMSNIKHMQRFKLRQRSLHVVQESLRVWEFRATSDTDASNFKSLSELILQSHNSLKNLYECSHPNLDKLVEISSQMGVSARLTGAGWGGCIVALCNSNELCDAYIMKLKEIYYKNLPQAKESNMDKFVFSTTPNGGAEIICLDLYSQSLNKKMSAVKNNEITFT